MTKIRALAAGVLLVWTLPAGADTQPFEAGSFAPPGNGPSPERIRVLSYNIRWRGGEQLRKLLADVNAPAIRGATLLGLQEVDRDKARTFNANTAREIAESLAMNYAWAAPPTTPGSDPPDEEETGVEILSAYPMSEITPLVLPEPGPKGRLRAAVGATVTIGDQRLRFYSVHAETQLTSKRRQLQLAAVLRDLEMHPDADAAIVTGDLNTALLPSKIGTRKQFKQAGFTDPFFLLEPTFYKGFPLRLDWVLLRGARVLEHGVYRKAWQSDHWPIWVDFQLPGS
jgi:endonuclease/exonuclease/phosphatase family metal-dependent hydrolase